MIRLCTKKNYKVLGGFSKLLKHSGFSHLISYIDIGTFEGKGYKESNWKFLKESLSYFNPKETEEINMRKNGFGKIWNWVLLRLNGKFKKAFRI